MARFNEILVGRYNRLAQKLLSMKGPASLVTLSDELFFAFPLFNGAENRYLEGWDRFTVLFNIAAVAGNTAGGRLRNPTGSNLLAVLEKVVYFNAQAAALTYVTSEGPIATDLASIGTGNRVDPRGRSSSSIIVSSQASTPSIADLPAPGGNQGLYTLLANTNYDQILFEDQALPLLPGEAFQVRGNAVNTVVECGIVWRERFLEESERT